jgi:ribose 5-phosphate isomerase A
MATPDDEKQAVAEAAAPLVEVGMVVGLGTGTTVAHLLPLLPARGVDYVASSPRTEEAARELGLVVRPFGDLAQVDLTIDGADQVAPTRWLVKGGGGAHTREKILAAAATRFVVIVSSDKLIERLHPPVPLELLPFGLGSTLRTLGPAKVRPSPPSPDGGVIADYLGAVGDPGALADRLAGTPGVVGHGLFPPTLVDLVLVARGTAVEPLE